MGENDLKKKKKRAENKSRQGDELAQEYLARKSPADDDWEDD